MICLHVADQGWHVGAPYLVLGGRDQVPQHAQPAREVLGAFDQVQEDRVQQQALLQREGSVPLLAIEQPQHCSNRLVLVAPKRTTFCRVVVVARPAVTWRRRR